MFDAVELAAGVRRVTFPLPTKPWHVHGYLLAGEDGWTLVDTGLAWPDLEERVLALGVPIARIVVTHFHPDHVGGADQVRAATGAPVSRASSTTSSASTCGGTRAGRSGWRPGSRSTASRRRSPTT